MSHPPSGSSRHHAARHNPARPGPPPASNALRPGANPADGDRVTIASAVPIRALLPAVLLAGWLPSVARADIPTPSQRAHWETILNDGVQVRCGDWQSDKWCEADAVLPASADTVLALMSTVEDLPQLFPRVVSMRRVEGDVVHEVIDYPFPYDDRDIVARFTWTHSEGTHTLSWSSVTTPVVPTVGVRLTGAEGSFELRPRPDGHTDLRYVWRGELGPGVPDWVRPFAWRGQAREVVDGLSQGLAR